VWILTAEITWLTLINPFWTAVTLSMFNPAFTQVRRSRCYSSRATGTPVAPTADSKLHTLLSARVWPFSELLRSPFPFLLDFDRRETFFRRPSSRVLFFGRLQYRPILDDSTQFDLRKTFNLHIFDWRFILVRSLQSLRDNVVYWNTKRKINDDLQWSFPIIICYGIVLFSVSSSV